MGNTGTTKHPNFLGGVHSYKRRDQFLKKKSNTEIIRITELSSPEALSPSDMVQ
jgi:hypothetical protein